VRIQFLHLDDELSSQLRAFSFWLLNQDLLCEFQLDQLLFDPYRDPVRIYVHDQLRCFQMLWYVQGKYCVLWVLKLFQHKLESTLITLTNLAFFVEHWAQFLLDKLFGISLFFLSDLVFIHFFIHFLSDLFSVSCFHLIFLLFCHVFLSLFSFPFFNLFFLQLKFSCLNGLKERFF
jgi:hypothetical protein